MRLKVWWIPQVPMKAFEVEVSAWNEAQLLLKTLANYDRFQFENRIKPDYINTGGVSVFVPSENAWWDVETKEDLEETVSEMKIAQPISEPGTPSE